MIPSRRSQCFQNRRVIAETGVIPAGMKLIRDTFEFKILDRKNAIREDKNGNGMPVSKVVGMIQMGDQCNGNGRYYSTSEVLAPAVKQIQEDIKARAVLGEFDHPSDAKIHLDRVSHLMTNVWMEGRKVFGEAEILHKLPCGACLRGLFEHKVRVGISSRGVGDMEVVNEGEGQETYRVLPGYTFVTWDAVAEPSVSGAILNIQEGLRNKLKPIKAMKRRFEPSVYQNLVVEEINKFFGLKR